MSSDKFYTVSKTSKSNEVILDNKYENIIKNQLGNVILSDNIENANKISKEINNRYKLVTLDGQVINIGGSITGGSINNNYNIIKEKYDLENNKIELNNLIKQNQNIENDLIEINKELEKSGKETLYLLYPVDGVAINDSPFAYIDNDQDRLDDFNKIQSFLLSKESQKKLEGYGKRTWYGGTNSSADSNSFRKDWGIDTTKYLIPLKYPSKDVMTEALALYLDEVRKPSATVFCLDYSGSMYGNGERDLKNAMEYILTYETAMKDKIQFSKKDHIYVIPFDDIVHSTLTTKNGRETVSLINEINRLSPGGQTNLYGCAEKAISILSDVSVDYTKAVILMTDGEANVGSYSSLEREYRIVVSKTNETIPIYSIMFASARESQLNDIARLTNAKVFDGRSNLTEAFKEVRSYN